MTFDYYGETQDTEYCEACMKIVWPPTHVCPNSSCEPCESQHEPSSSA